MTAIAVQEKHRVIEPNAKTFLKWFRERGGIAIWGSVNLSNPSQTWSTPIHTESGERYTKPNWQCSTEPTRLITDMDEVLVDTPREVKRFHVAIRRGDQGLSFKLTDGSTAKVRREMAKAGDDAWYEFDYGTQEAVILVPHESMSLREWANKYGE